MRNIIKKGLLLLFLSLAPQIQVISQTTLDSIQAKTLCLILNEHEKLTVENPLLKQQIKSLEELNQLYLKSDSIRIKEMDLYKDKIASDEKEINKLKITNKKIIYGSSIGGIVLFILGILL